MTVRACPQPLPFAIIAPSKWHQANAVHICHPLQCLATMTESHGTMKDNHMKEAALKLNKAYLGVNVRGAASVAAREDGLEGC